VHKGGDISEGDGLGGGPGGGLGETMKKKKTPVTSPLPGGRDGDRTGAVGRRGDGKADGVRVGRVNPEEKGMPH